jgi:putative pyruvate formate lyase activating enzyme
LSHIILSALFNSLLETLMSYIPSYINLHTTGELQKRISALTDMLKECRLCPRHCKVNRLQGEIGFCRAGDKLMLSSAFAHFGEEAPLVGHMGSGTIFFTHCNLRCVFCQNHDISHRGQGETVTSPQMALYMVALQQRGCHNINFVTPTHYVPQIVAALPYAVERGLRILLVYNCGGYESLEVIKLLDGIIDIYMPDVKWADSGVAEKYAQAPDYPAVIRHVLKEMHRQVGDLQTSKEGVAERGLLIRHLVMPDGLAGTRELMHYIATEISPHSYVNIMSQYHPEYKARDFPELNRRISNAEYTEAFDCARDEGLYRI